MNCPKCGTINEEGNRFCGSCGNPLAAATGLPPVPPLAPGTRAPGGITAKPTQRVPENDVEGHTAVRPSFQAGPTRRPDAPPHLPPAPVAPAPAPPTPPTPHVAPQAPPTPRVAPLQAPPTRLSAAPRLPVSSVPQPNTEVQRLPVQQVSNLTRAVVSSSGPPMHFAAEDRVRAIALWAQLYGCVGVAAGAFMVSTDAWGVLLIGVGVISLAVGILLVRHHPVGRMLGLVLGALSIAAAGVALIHGATLPIGPVWAAVVGAFGVLTCVALASPQAAEVCTPQYLHQAEQAEHDGTTNLSTPFFWLPGVLTGVGLIIQSFR